MVRVLGIIRSRLRYAGQSGFGADKTEKAYLLVSVNTARGSLTNFDERPCRDQLGIG